MEGILQDDLTNDTFAAALSVTHMFSRPQPERDCPLGIGKGLEILESLHASSLRGRPDMTVLVLDDSSTSVSAVCACREKEGGIQGQFHQMSC